MLESEYNQAELDLDFLMERIIQLAWPNGTINSIGLQQMIADSNPGYPVTSELGIGTIVTIPTLVQAASVIIGSYPIFYPAPLADGSDPENIFANYSTVEGYIYPTMDIYDQLQVRHLLVGRSPVDQRWEIINDSQVEYGANIRSQLEFSI